MLLRRTILLYATLAQSAQRGIASFSNAVRYLFDTDGNQIDAYAMKINFFHGKYYLYGVGYGHSSFMTSTTLYSSTDLINWNYDGLICQGVLGCGGGRPHMVYNEKSKQYVLWSDFPLTLSGYRVATSSTPSKPFTKARNNAALDPKHGFQKPADFSLASINGTGYAVYSMLDFRYKDAGDLWPPINQSMYISRLTDDYMSTDRVSYPVRTPAFDLIDNEAESPDMFYRNGFYYVAASNTCANCNGSIGLLYRSRSIEGPWTRQILAGSSCDGQVEGVLPLVDPVTNETTFVWHSTSVPGGPRVAWTGHVFSPLRFNVDGSAHELDCSANASFQVPFTMGSKPANTSGKALVATDGTPAIANYHPVCDSDTVTLYQTWTSSQSGILKDVSINIAAGNQKVPLQVKVFRFLNYESFVAPNSKIESLGSRTVLAGSNDLKYSFETIIVSDIDAKVNAGDNLGFYISGADFSPYCHLEYDKKMYPGGIREEAPGKLFVQGAGQNSWRGINGKSSPIFEREGKGIKFFATVQ